MPGTGRLAPRRTGVGASALGGRAVARCFSALCGFEGVVPGAVQRGNQGRAAGRLAVHACSVGGGGPFVGRIGGPLAHHAGQSQQRLGPRRRGAGDARVQAHGPGEALFQHLRVHPQLRLAVTLDIQVGSNIAALEGFGGEVLEVGLQRLPRGGETKTQFEAAAVDVAQFPDPGEGADQPLGAGETGYGSDWTAYVPGFRRGGWCCESYGDRPFSASALGMGLSVKILSVRPVSPVAWRVE
jgi:hypothetical protein